MVKHLQPHTWTDQTHLCQAWASDKFMIDRIRQKQMYFEVIQRLSVFRCYCCQDMELKFVLQTFFWLFQTIPAAALHRNILLHAKYLIESFASRNVGRRVELDQICYKIIRKQKYLQQLLLLGRRSLSPLVYFSPKNCNILRESAVSHSQGRLERLSLLPFSSA